MTYKKALTLIRKRYQTIYDAPHCEIIRTGRTLDGYHSFTVALYDYKDGKLVITDLGETKEVFDEVTEETWRKICEEKGFVFNHWRLEKEFVSMKTVTEFIKFLNYIADLFDPI